MRKMREQHSQMKELLLMVAVAVAVVVVARVLDPDHNQALNAA
jgi:hypothetical protein